MKPHLRLIQFIGLLVPQRLRADWRQEWEAELHYSATLLARWEKLNWRNKFDLWRRSLGAFTDALLLQPRRLEDEMWQDLRYGWRTLRQRKGFSLLAALALALGIGANTALFSVVEAILLRPLPYPHAARLVSINGAELKQQAQWAGWNRTGVPLADFRVWRNECQSCEEMALASYGESYSLAGDDDRRLARGSRVSLNLFALLGAQLALGRSFQPEDEKPESARVVILSHAFWVEHYQANPNALGQQLTLNEQPHTIVGVLAADFRDYFNLSYWDNRERVAPLLVSPRRSTQIWLPLNVTHEAATWHGRGGQRHGSYQVLARLKPSVTLAQAQNEISTSAAQLAARYPESNHELGAAVFALHEEVTGGSRRTLLLLAAAFSLVLLIACANVASLLLARGIERAQELALRVTLGAGQWRVLRQLLTECLLLAALGGAWGLALAYALVAGVKPLIPADVPRAETVALNYRALLCTAGLILLTTLLAGLLPAWQAARLKLAEELKEAGRSATTSCRARRWRHALVISQIALTMILLAGAGLLTKSFWQVQYGAVGYDTRNLVFARVPPPRPYPRERYLRVQPDATDAAELNDYWNPLLARVRSTPGVMDAAFTTSYPLRGVNFLTHLRIPGVTPDEPRGQPVSNGEVVHRDYFRLLKLRLVQGRLFNDDDRAEALTALIVNEQFARVYFPQRSAVGQTVLFRSGPKLETSATIVGVVTDVRTRLDRPLEPQFYRLLEQTPLRGFNLLVRTADSSAASLDALREALRSFNPHSSYNKPVALEEVRADLTIRPRFYLALLGSLALLALLLAASGVYGALLLTVSQRTHEIGVRRALGAQDRAVLWLVLRQGAGLALTGLALGLCGAWALTRFIRGWLVEVSPTDPLTLAVVAAVLWLAALLACLGPARRAVRVDPLRALRHE